MATTEILPSRISSPVTGSTSPAMPAARAVCWRMLSTLKSSAARALMETATEQSVILTAPLLSMLMVLWVLSQSVCLLT